MGIIRPARRLRYIPAMKGTKRWIATVVTAAAAVQVWVAADELLASPYVLGRILAASANALTFIP
jgi:hypothetical protein